MKEVSSSDVKPTAFKSPCMNCNGAHTLEVCDNVFALPFYDRIDILRDHRLCYGCLKPGHSRRNCRSKATCSHCGGRHPSVLHVDGKIPPRESKPAESQDQISQSVGSACNTDYYKNDSAECTMAIIPVKVALSGSSRII